jgi:uncharacterized protein (DUF1810 family)
MAGDRNDPFHLSRFVAAQERDYARALTEIQDGRKRTHWIWYVFPQIEGLGRSSMATQYAIRSAAEAEAYLSHPVLGPRLMECCEAALAVEGLSAREVFGSPDDLKVRSCATLFAAISPPGSVFERLLDRYYAGVPDEPTLRFLKSERKRLIDSAPR